MYYAFSSGDFVFFDLISDSLFAHDANLPIKDSQYEFFCFLLPLYSAKLFKKYSKSTSNISLKNSLFRSSAGWCPISAFPLIGPFSDFDNKAESIKASEITF